MPPADTCSDDAAALAEDWLSVATGAVDFACMKPLRITAYVHKLPEGAQLLQCVPLISESTCSDRACALNLINWRSWRHLSTFSASLLLSCAASSPQLGQLLHEGLAGEQVCRAVDDALGWLRPRGPGGQALIL